jgi:hypothetical protein
MADEHISYRAMVNYEVGPMAYTMQGNEFGLRNDSTAPVVSGIGAGVARLARRLADAFAAQRQREVDREISRLLARAGGPITDSMEREIMRKALASDWSLPL